VRSQFSRSCYKRRMGAGFIARHPSRRPFLGSIRSGTLCVPILLSKDYAKKSSCERRIERMPWTAKFYLLMPWTEAVFFVCNSSVLAISKTFVPFLSRNCVRDFSRFLNDTANGVFSLFDNTTGGSNTGTGFAALGNNTTGSFNTANGVNALLDDTTGNSNTATGFQALQGNTTGANNTANGFNALASNTTGFGNAAMGDQALQGNTTGNANIAIGTNALVGNTTGGSNTAIGNGALFETLLAIPTRL
jgi:hypothetical protein